MSKTIFISTKFKGSENEEHLRTLEKILGDLKFKIYLPVKDLVEFGRKDTHLFKDHQGFMEATKKQLENADYILVDWQEKGVGIGVEAGAGWILNKPVIVVRPKGTEVSMTIEGIATKIIDYTNYNELKDKLNSYFAG